MTSSSPKKSQLLINMRMKGKSKNEYVKYGTFEITDEASKYVLKISGLSGNVTPFRNALDYNNNRKFTTKDQDNDIRGNINCAKDRGGGWWYGSCSHVFLNGDYKFKQFGRYTTPISWHYDESLAEFVEIKTRRNL